MLSGLTVSIPMKTCEQPAAAALVTKLGVLYETVSICMLNDIYLQYIRVIQSTHQLRFHTDEGSMRPLTLSAMGWLLLTDRSDAEIEKLVRRANIATPRKEDRVPLEVVAAASADRGAGRGCLAG